MNVSRLEPWSLMNVLHGDHEHFANRRFGSRPGSIADWTPAIDIIEEQDRFVLRADLPGVNPEDIEINMEKNVLSVSGERHLESKSETESARRIERRSGRFSRRFTLPDTAHADDVSATSTNGILEIVIPKQAELKPRKITVKAA